MNNINKSLTDKYEGIYKIYAEILDIKYFDSYLLKVNFL
jgi:hypothetical protein